MYYTQLGITFILVSHSLSHRSCWSYNIGRKRRRQWKVCCTWIGWCICLKIACTTGIYHVKSYANAKQVNTVTLIVLFSSLYTEKRITINLIPLYIYIILQGMIPKVFLITKEEMKSTLFNLWCCCTSYTGCFSGKGRMNGTPQKELLLGCKT